MIVFDLRCTAGHVFEAWFGSTAGYEEQRAGGLVACPICGDSRVEKAVMAPNVAAKGNRSVPVARESADSAPAAPDAEQAKALLARLAQLQSRLLEGSQWVGTAFADRARAMHSGEAEEAPIHGQTSIEEARELAEEGVPVAPLLFPVVPPEAAN